MKQFFSVLSLLLLNVVAQSQEVGKKAPEIALPTSKGDTLKLSSLKGKVVMIDFWASWCDPCRKENPNVLNAYNEFKDKNFTILGVSLDKNSDDWKKAIREDRLNWTQISDLSYWESKAVKTFHFEGIPYNILVDPQGKVIGESLRGPALINKLNEVLK